MDELAILILSFGKSLDRVVDIRKCLIFDVIRIESIGHVAS